jgi:hypothetical protein
VRVAFSDLNLLVRRFSVLVYYKPFRLKAANVSSLARSCFFAAAMIEVTIEAPGSAYPRLIQIQPGDTIRFLNTLTQNGVEHTITPDKTHPAHEYFGGLSFYASDLGGLWVPYQEIKGTYVRARRVPNFVAFGSHRRFFKLTTASVVVSPCAYASGHLQAKASDRFSLQTGPRQIIRITASSTAAPRKASFELATVPEVSRSLLCLYVSDVHTLMSAYIYFQRRVFVCAASREKKPYCCACDRGSAVAARHRGADEERLRCTAGFVSRFETGQLQG